MSIEQILVAAGARCVGGDLILKNDSLGQYRNGAFQPSLAGVALAEELAKAKQEEILAVAREANEDDRPRRGRPPKAKAEE